MINDSNILSQICKPDLSAIINSNVFFVIISVIVFFILVKMSHKIIGRLTSELASHNEDYEFKKQIETIKHVICSSIDFAILIIILMLILNKIGVDIRPILTAAGVLGVAVGFGAKRFVEDIITGLIILFEGQIRVGDVLEISGKTGTVENFNLKMVVLRDINGTVHYIRNGMIDVVSNLTRDYSYYTLDLRVSYNKNIDFITQTLEKVFKEELMSNQSFSKNILSDLEILGIDKFSSTAVILKLRIKTKPTCQWAVGREFNRLIKNRFDELQIEFPSDIIKYEVE